jgi:arylformamidase
VLLLENLDLRGVEAGLYQLICQPLKITGAEGAPCRALLGPLPD